MLELLGNFEKVLGLLVVLATLFFFLAQTAKVVLKLRVPEGMWQEVKLTTGSLLWIMFMSVLGYALWAVHVLIFSHKWVVTVILLPGILATAVLGVKPVVQIGQPRWLSMAVVVTGLLYFLGAVTFFLVVSLDQAGSEIKNSCELQSDGTLAVAVATGDARCVDYWLQQSPSATDGGVQPLLYVAAGGSDAHVLGLLLASGQFDSNMPTSDGDTPLHAAVRNSRHDMVCRLLAHGANRNFPNSEKVTPLDLAADLKKQDLMALLAGDNCFLAAQ